MKLERLAKRNRTKVIKNIITLAFRFALGLPLGGYRRTDSTYFRRGTTDLSKGSPRLQLKKTGKWDYFSFFERMLARWIILTIILSTVYGYFYARETLTIALIWAGVVAFAVVTLSLIFVIKYHEKIGRKMKVKSRRIST